MNAAWTGNSVEPQLIKKLIPLCALVALLRTKAAHLGLGRRHYVDISNAYRQTVAQFAMSAHESDLNKNIYKDANWQ